jgi:hypothetical protein
MRNYSTTVYFIFIIICFKERSTGIQNLIKKSYSPEKREFRAPDGHMRYACGQKTYHIPPSVTRDCRACINYVHIQEVIYACLKDYQCKHDKFIKISLPDNVRNVSCCESDLCNVSNEADKQKLQEEIDKEKAKYEKIAAAERSRHQQAGIDEHQQMLQMQQMLQQHAANVSTVTTVTTVTTAAPHLNVTTVAPQPVGKKKREEEETQVATVSTPIATESPKPTEKEEADDQTAASEEGEEE